MQRSRFDSRHYQIFWKVVGLERDPLSLMSTTEGLLGRKSSGPGLENREYGCIDPSRWPRSTLYPQKLALTPPTSGGLSVGIVRSRTHRSRSFFFFFLVFVTLSKDVWADWLRQFQTRQLLSVKLPSAMRVYSPAYSGWRLGDHEATGSRSRTHSSRSGDTVIRPRMRHLMRPAANCLHR
jgi:hypothetical protein